MLASANPILLAKSLCVNPLLASITRTACLKSTRTTSGGIVSLLVLSCQIMIKIIRKNKKKIDENTWHTYHIVIRWGYRKGKEKGIIKQWKHKKSSPQSRADPRGWPGNMSDGSIKGCSAFTWPARPACCQTATRRLIIAPTYFLPHLVNFIWWIAQNQL